jgi:hypothetical protein
MIPLSEAKQIATTVAIYTTDYDDKFPDIKNVTQANHVMRTYLEKRPIEPGGSWELPNDYIWNSALAGRSATTLQDPSKTWVFHTGQENGQYGVAFADTSVRRVTESELDTIMATPTRFNPDSEAN